MSGTGKPSTGGGRYRADIDGLRAIAVSSVVLYHADHTLLSSGFVGVDIFFVISGYLIGGILFSEITAKHFTYAAFYARRARRILPALIALTLIWSLAFLFLLGAGEIVGFGRQAISALIGVSNIYFWWKTGYFNADAALNPYLMTWSLGVEEQFYVVFPILLFGISRLSHRLRLAALAGLTLLSFAASIYMTWHNPTAAFYLLPPRAWEMSSGALLSIAYQEAKHLATSRSRSNDLAAVIGLGLLVASIFLFDDNTRFPGYAALLPVAGTLILLHTSESLINRKLLSARPMVFLGLVSYSWYLWHWPLMSIARIVTDYSPNRTAMLGIAVVSLICGIVSWRFIERPFRQPTRRDIPTLTRYACAIALAAFLPAIFVASGGLPQRLPAIARSNAAIYSLGAGRCLTNFGTALPMPGKYCQPDHPQVALFGDSHAAALSPGLRQAVTGQGKALLQLEQSACTPLVGITTSDSTRPNHAGECATFIRASLDRIEKDPAIKLVVIGGSWPNIEDPRYRDANGTYISAADAVSAGFGPMLDELSGAGKTIIVVGDVPRFEFDPMRHLLSDQLPARSMIVAALDDSRRVTGTSIDKWRLNPNYIPIATQIQQSAAGHPHTYYFNLSDSLCDAQRCNFASADGRSLFFDQHHLSFFGASTIDWRPMLEKALH